MLDWEHLPWLHRESFSRIDVLEAGSEGWRAQVGLAPAEAGQEILLEVSLERPALRYVARTLEGPGRGTEIWTRLDPIDARRTDIEVEFLVPACARSSAARSAAPTKCSTRCSGTRTSR